MDPRVLVSMLLKLRGRCTGWYVNDDTTALNAAISVIQRFCYPTLPRITKVNGSKQYFCARCNRKILRTHFWCPHCGQRVLVEQK